MKCDVSKLNVRKIYRKAFWTKEKEFNFWCFMCGFVTAMIIAVILVNMKF